MWKIKKSFTHACLRAWTGVVISADGNVLPCCFDKQEKYMYDNINKDSIENIWKNKKSIDFRNKLLTDRASFDMCCNCNE